MAVKKEDQLGGLTVRELTLKWPYGAIRLEGMALSRKPGEHAKLYVKGRLKEKAGHDVVRHASSGDEVGLWVKGDTFDAGSALGQDYPLFLGQLDQLELIESQGNERIELVVVSHTQKLDGERKSRSFQHAGLTYHQVITEVLAAFPGANYRIDAFEPSQKVGKLLLQYEETDWEFLHRIASHAGAMLTPDVSRHGVSLWVGAPSGLRRHKLPSGMAYQMSRDVGAFVTAVPAAGEALGEQIFTRCTIKLDKLYALGDQVELNGVWFTVVGMKAELEQSMLAFEYDCAIAGGVRRNKLYNPYLVGLAVEGKVIAVAPKKAKVHLDIDPQQPEQEAVWFPYSSSASHFIHSMPQVGSRVKLYFPGKQEEDAMLINSVRTPSSGSGEAAAKAEQKMADTTVKSFTTSYGKDFTLGLQDITFTATEGALFLSMNEETGIELASDKDIVLSAPEELSFKEFKTFQAQAEDEIIVLGKGGSLILNDNSEAGGSKIIADGSDRQSYSVITNPEAEQAKIDKEKEGFWDKVQMGLDVLGMLPGVGAVFDVVNAGISLARGDFLGAGMSLLCMVPGVGDAFGAAKIASKVAKKVGKAVLKQGGEKALVLAKSQMDKVLTAAKRVKGQADNLQKQVEGKIAKMQEQLADRTKSLLAAAAKNTMVNKGLTALNHKVLSKFGGTKGLKDKFCKWGFEPVDLITGRMMSEAEDFAFPGPLPLSWERRWISDSRHNGWLGHGAHHALDMRLSVMGDGIGVLLGDGRVASFELLHRGKIEMFNRLERLTLRRLGKNYTLYDHESRLTYYFEPAVIAETMRDKEQAQPKRGLGSASGLTQRTITEPEQEIIAGKGYRLTRPVPAKPPVGFMGTTAKTLAAEEQRDGQESLYRLHRVENEFSHRIALYYDERGFIRQVIDSVGRELEVGTDQAGRMTAVTHVYGKGYSRKWDLLVRYAYNEAGDLIAITDALGQTTHIRYDQHLMVRKTDRNGYSFHWHYDGPTTGARCVHTYGDDGLLEGKIRYDNGFNEVENSQGHRTVFEYDERYFCTRMVNPLGGIYCYSYNDQADLLSETDEDGIQTAYEYDEQGQLTKQMEMDGSEWRFAYTENGQLLKVIDPEGGMQSWKYDADGHVRGICGADGATTTFQYDEQHRLIEVKSPFGTTAKFGYDEQHNLIEATSANGAISRWTYDHRGVCLEESNAAGAKQIFAYDALGRVTQISLPDGDVMNLQYNAYDDVILAENNQQRVRFGYTPLGKLRWREEKNRRVDLLYNQEEELVGVVNEREERYELERDANGQIVREIGFDGLARSYAHSTGGLLKRITRPGNRWTAFRHNPQGQITQTEYSDGWMETYAYNRIGHLFKTTNPHTTVKFEYNQAGQLMKEWRDDYWVASEYDEQGNRIAMSSSFGAQLTIDRDEIGQVKRMEASQTLQEQRGSHSSAKENSSWQARMKYNALGQEIERLLPGGMISSWQYDAAGHPERHKVKAGGSESRKRTYEWGINNRLKSIKDDLFGKRATYSYNDFGDLVASDSSENFSRLFRHTDEVGNLYGDRYEPDREYGSGGRLLSMKGTRYRYDEEGQLVEKIDAGGKRWQYDYYGNGMMSRVVRPDGQEVTFKYDPLGRRIEKHFGGMVNCYVWDGNNILHEWKKEKVEEAEVADTISDQLITWIFDEGTFHPAAKITSEGTYSIITNHLGTPVEMYDESGTKMWSCELDIYGQIPWYNLQGKRKDCPFRYPGQYEDEETGLYYNRFRYYSPQEGMYTQQDPIRLAGGFRLYGYVLDPNVWMDPFGLSSTKLDKQLQGRVGDKMQAHHVIPEEIWKKYILFFNDVGLGGRMDEAFNGIHLPDSSKTAKVKGMKVFHNGSHPLYSAIVEGRIEVILSLFEEEDGINKQEARKMVRKLQMEMKNKIWNGDVPINPNNPIIKRCKKLS
ncbi:RHS repeat-associated core domain-containing protein [Paenibacillus algorifonticola]|uniref:RHS repeat-associated core domain-containing protein n=1 Tax=Paenibacillus algorifonticola TaxID=684063 RepID=A0A1I2CDY9_9BACL|nr:DUF6531 domain-containing protein [Paenibacillus algorifonticola]SFE66458.1 RHS repeat-associated core domain-containing protein [Paenibacillus algorifonticola]